MPSPTTLARAAGDIEQWDCDDNDDNLSFIERIVIQGIAFPTTPEREVGCSSSQMKCLPTLTFCAWSKQSFPTV